MQAERIAFAGLLRDYARGELAIQTFAARLCELMARRHEGVSGNNASLWFSAARLLEPQTELWPSAYTLSRARSLLGQRTHEIQLDSLTRQFGVYELRSFSEESIIDCGRTLLRAPDDLFEAELPKVARAAIATAAAERNETAVAADVLLLAESGLPWMPVPIRLQLARIWDAERNRLAEQELSALGA